MRADGDHIPRRTIRRRGEDGLEGDASCGKGLHPTHPHSGFEPYRAIGDLAAEARHLAEKS